MSESNASLNDREPPSKKRPGTAKVTKKKSEEQAWNSGTDLADIQSFSTLNARASDSKNSLFQDEDVKMARANPKSSLDEKKFKHVKRGSMSQKKLLANVYDLKQGGYTSLQDQQPTKLYYAERGGKLHRKGSRSRSAKPRGSPKKRGPKTQHRDDVIHQAPDSSGVDSSVIDELRRIKQQMKEKEMIEIENRIQML
jgi:hypothetical protein